MWSALVSWSPISNAAASEWRIIEVDIDGPVERIDVSDRVLVFASGKPHEVIVEAKRAYARPAKKGREAPKLPADALPDGEVTLSRKTTLADTDIAAAWYAEPTTRYGHGILGDAVEAAALVVRDGKGREHRLRLPESEVFEDRFPRLADIDGDGHDEIITIRSNLRKGAALAVYRLGPNGIEEAASIPPIGRANRWLNVAAIADLTGDGHLDIALVKTPHIGGTLEIWALSGGSLKRVASARGFSNHAIGTREQRLSAALDLTDDGVADLVVPSANRRALRLMTFKGGALTELASIRLPAPIASDIGVITTQDGRAALIFAGSDGKLRVLRR